ncbi:MAG: HAD-IIIA family hydrolase [Melioribacteraceae bacterium]|nr:HAD-IIIA family hydrolase [Melioribacteraceae bacterium]
MVDENKNPAKDLIDSANKIKLVLTDCDGVLTDTGIYYSAYGEELKRFSIRDGMGVERLRNSGIETGIITGEFSEHVIMRAKKLNITELHLRVKDKRNQLEEILERKGLKSEDIAYIGDDTNDIEIMQAVGLSACPADAMSFARKYADIVLETNGGQGAFREFAERILEAKTIFNIKELL